MRLKSYEENKCIRLNKSDGYCHRVNIICPNSPDHCLYHKYEKEMQVGKDGEVYFTINGVRVDDNKNEEPSYIPDDTPIIDTGYNERILDEPFSYEDHGYY